MSRKLWIIGHRGAAGNAPENTMSSFKRAVQAGADMIELDVQLTRDNHLVVMHDPTVNRTTSGRGKVGDFTLAELQSLDAGSWFGAEYAGEIVPTLEQVIRQMVNHCYINIEVKSNERREKGKRPMEEILLETIKGKPLVDRLLISSFDYPLLTRIKRLNPHLKLAFLFSNKPWNLGKKLNEGILYAIHPGSRVATEKLIAAAHAQGLQVNVWTVDNQQQMMELFEAGADGIITNFPELGTAARCRLDMPQAENS